MPKVCDIWDSLGPENQHNADNEFWTYALEMFLIFVLSARTESHVLDYVFTGKAPRVRYLDEYTPKEADYARRRKFSWVTLLMIGLYSVSTLGYFVSYALMLDDHAHLSELSSARRDDHHDSLYGHPPRQCEASLHPL